MNLPTWVWLDEDTFSPVSVRAELDGYGIWAETTATPVRLVLDAGMDDVTYHPGTDGVCELNEAGTIGEAYREGRSDEEPPCGLTYLRATGAGGAHDLAATLVWDVTWQDSFGAQGTLPDGEFSSTVAVEVDEVQAIVR